MTKLSSLIMLIAALVFTGYGATIASIAWFGDARVPYILGGIHTGLIAKLLIDKCPDYSSAHFIVDAISILFCVYGVVVFVSGF